MYRFKTVFAATLVLFWAVRLAAAQHCEAEVLSQFGGVTQDIALQGTTAYVANGDGGLLIADVSNPDQIVVLSTLPMEVSIAPDVRLPARHVAVSGQYAFVTSAYVLVVVDVSDPARPFKIGEATTGFIGALALTGTTLYSVSEYGFSVIDVSDPSRPDVRGTNTTIRGTVVAGNGPYAFIAGLGFPCVVDATDQTNPVQIGTFALAGRPTGLAASGSLLIAVSANTVRAFDCSDPGDPVLASQLNLPNASGVALQSGSAYTFSYHGFSSSIQEIDISDPTRLSVARVIPIDEPIEASGLTVSGSIACVIHPDFGLGSVRMETPIRAARVKTSASAQRCLVLGNRVFIGDLYDHLLTLDGSDPRHPQFLAQAPNYTATAVRVRNDIAYVAAGSSGFRTYDVASPRETRYLGGLYFSGDGYAQAIEFSGEIACVAEGVGGLRLLSVSNAAAPMLLGTLPTTNARDVVTSGSIAFIADGSSLKVADVSDPAHPTLLSSLPLPQGSNRLSLAEGLVLVATGNGLHIIDAANPAQPVEVGFLQSWWGFNVVRAADRFAYVADATWKLRVVDFSDPSNPFVLSDIDLPTQINDLAIDGSTLWAACDTYGVFAIDVSAFQPPNCPADFNCSGGTPDSADIAAFFDAWDNGDSYADLNRSGGTPDDSDIAAFFQHWAGGC